MICVGYLQEQRWLIGVIFMVPVYAISAVTLKNSLLSFSLQSFTSNANLSVIRVILQLNGTLGGQLVVPYDFPLVVLQTISMIFSTCDGA